MIRDIEFTSMEGKRFAPIDFRPQEVRIDQNLSIVDIRKEGENFRVFFKFITTFSGMGSINIEGNLLYNGIDLEPSWKKDKSITESAAQEIQGSIFAASTVETILLARDLRLPPPLPMPTIQKKKDIIGFG